MAEAAPTYHGFRAYPRGFLGAPLGEQVKPMERTAAAQLRAHTCHPDWFKPARAAKETNQNIEALWRYLNDNYHSIDKMDFREKILKIALGAFGTDNFYDWVRLQIASPFTGDFHLNFIQDMLRFIDHGKHEMSLHNWTGLLSMSEIHRNDTEDEGQFNWFFVTEDKRPKNISLTDVLQRWCSQKDGFMDLAQSLHVLFGDL